MKILFIVYDNDSYTSYFPIGLAYLVAICQKHGHEVEIYQQDINHYPDEHLTRYLDSRSFDFVGLSFIGGYYQYRKAVAISKAVNASRQRPFFAVGGHGPSPEPEFFLHKLQADCVCIGEGEETVIDLLNCLDRRGDLSSIQGIAYREGGRVQVNEARPLIKNIDDLPLPAYSRFPIEVYRLLRASQGGPTDFVMPMLSGRGCTFACNFCYRLDKGFRPRSAEMIIEEMQLLQKDYGITYVIFADELLMSSAARTTSVCEAMIRANLNVRWSCQGRLNYAKGELLKLMERAGCRFINYGVEAFDDNSLRLMNKSLTTRQITAGVEATLAAGISPGLNVIFGNYGDDRSVLRKSVDFLLKYDDGAQLRTIRPVTPYPGSPLYYDAIAAGKLRDCEDFYENKHTNSDLMSVNFTKLTDAEFYEALYEANTVLLENYYKKQSQRNREILTNLYIKHDSNFRGFRRL